MAALGPDLLRLMTPRNPAFHAAAPIIPVVALAYLLHGVFLLTSVGIGIARQARYYPMVTAAAATTNVAANLLLIPRFGAMGAAWATVLAYAVMAALGFTFSRRVFAIPFEGGRSRIPRRRCPSSQRAGPGRRQDRRDLAASPGRIPARGLGSWCPPARREAASPSYIRVEGLIHPRRHSS